MDLERKERCCVRASDLECCAHASRILSPKSGTQSKSPRPLALRRLVLCATSRLRAATAEHSNHDCRGIFYPLAANALHITKTSWQNDDLLPTKALKKGLEIWFDVVPDQLSLVGGGQPSASPTVIVSVEAPIQSGATAPDSTFILDTKISLQSDSILLQIVEDSKLFDELIGRQALVRVRVTLKGHAIFSQRGGDMCISTGRRSAKRVCAATARHRAVI